MTETPLTAIHQGIVDVFRRAIPAVRAEGAPQELSREMATLIPTIIRNAAGARDLWDDLWKEFEEVPADESDYLRCGNELIGVLNSWHGVLQDLRNTCDALALRGVPVPNSSALRTALQENEQLQALLKKNWPWPDRQELTIDPKMVEESRAAIERGECDDLEDLIRGLPDESRATS
ncbi:MAG: hypothetical protein K2R98_08235 [Gemmataceae bacterium]|nr:hypothetical protein [Gemmataceae bacterium]